MGQEQGGDIGTAVDQDEQELDTGRVTTLVDKEGVSNTAVDEGCATSSAEEGEDKSDMAETAGGRDEGGSAGEKTDDGEGGLSGKGVEDIVGVSIGLEPLEDIIEEDEEVEQREDPIDREELLAGTKVVTFSLNCLNDVDFAIHRRCYLNKRD